MRKPRFLRTVFPAAMLAAYLILPGEAFSQGNPCAAKNPCAANPCAAKNPCAANPCAAKNPCAANPCAANPCKGGASLQRGKGIMAVGEIVRVEPKGKFVLASEGKKIPLTVANHGVVREGKTVRTVQHMRPGRKATVSYVDTGTSKTAWYIYLASAAAASNPCGGGNPCAANPCAAKNPCAANPGAAKNPCAANPCAAKNPCAANPCAKK